MALLTDDCDVREVYMQTSHGNNGDYYLSLFEYPKKGFGPFSDTKVIHYRMAMSGGATSHHQEVRQAFVALCRAMEVAGLNKHPKDDESQH